MSKCLAVVLMWILRCGAQLSLNLISKIKPPEDSACAATIWSQCRLLYAALAWVFTVVLANVMQTWTLNHLSSLYVGIASNARPLDFSKRHMGKHVGCAGSKRRCAMFFECTFHSTVASPMHRYTKTCLIATKIKLRTRNVFTVPPTEVKIKPLCRK